MVVGIELVVPVHLAHLGVLVGRVTLFITVPGIKTWLSFDLVFTNPANWMAAISTALENYIIMSFTHLEAQHISYYTLFLYPISSESCYLLHLKVVRTLISLQGHQIKVPKILTGNPLINAIQILIFLTSKVSFLVQKLEYRATVITVIRRRVPYGAFVNVHMATSLEIYM